MSQFYPLAVLPRRRAVVFYFYVTFLIFLPFFLCPQRVTSLASLLVVSVWPLRVFGHNLALPPVRLPPARISRTTA